MCTLDDFDWMSLDDEHRHLLTAELDMWHEDYLPVTPGATVLDVGAGCGETAWFYLAHGAGHVICIEADDGAVRLLRRNLGDHPWVTVVHARVDKIKIDIEGAEEGMDLETHMVTPEFRLMRNHGGHSIAGRQVDVRQWRLIDGTRAQADQIAREMARG